MGLETRMLRQRAVYWRFNGNNEFGEATYEEPIVIKCRWEEKALVFISQTGEEEVSQAKVYVDRDIPIASALLLDIGPKNENPLLTQINQDDTDNPFINDLAFKVRGWEKIPDLKAKKFVRAALL